MRERYDTVVDLLAGRYIVDNMRKNELE